MCLSPPVLSRPHLIAQAFTFPRTRTCVRIQHGMANRSASGPPHHPQHAAACLHAARSSCTGVQHATLIAGARDWEGTQRTTNMAAQSTVSMQQLKEHYKDTQYLVVECAAALHCRSERLRDSSGLRTFRRASSGRRSLSISWYVCRVYLRNRYFPPVAHSLSPSDWLLPCSRSLRHWWRRWARPSTRSK